MAELSGLASEIADARFNSSPRILNKLLNRAEPSSNAVRSSEGALEANGIWRGSAASWNRRLSG